MNNNNNNTIMAATATTRHTNTAQVTFRVKCDDTATIGHGEDVLLVDSEGIKVRAERSSNASSIISLFTTTLRMLTLLLCPTTLSSTLRPPLPPSLVSRLSPCQYYIMITSTSY